MSWNVFKPLKPVQTIPGGGGGDIPEEILQDLYNHLNNSTIHLNSTLLTKINNSVSINVVQSITDKLNNKDVVFKMMSPLFEGIQEETEFLFPYTGVIKNIHSSISLDSTLSSNTIFSLQIYRGGIWETVETIQIPRTQYSLNTTINNISINSNRLRISLLNGDFINLKQLDVIVTIADPIVVE